MKTIEHRPNEHKRMPDYDSVAAKQKYGENPTPWNLFQELFPVFLVAVGLYIWRSF